MPSTARGHNLNTLELGSRPPGADCGSLPAGSRSAPSLVAWTSFGASLAALALRGAGHRQLTVGCRLRQPAGRLPVASFLDFCQGFWFSLPRWMVPWTIGGGLLIYITLDFGSGMTACSWYALWR